MSKKLKRRDPPPWCERHWAPAREDSTVNGMFLGMLVMQALLEDEEAMDMRRVIHATNNEAMNLIVRKLSPICCHLGDEKMKQLIEEARTQ